jgi:hypothetical protein
MSLHPVRDASPGRKYATTHLCIPSGMPRPVEKHAITHLCIPPRGCIPVGMHELHMAATGRCIICRAMQS